MADGANWETCSGTFYDSGGAAGNYGSSENMTATLCPAGGPGAGPASSITFTSWNVNLLDLFDALIIYDGANASGPVLATGNGLNSLQGQSFVSSDPSGCLTFVWTSDLLLNGGGWAARITTGPDAGGDGSTTVCSNAAPFDLFSLLTGTPDPGGQWTRNGNLVGNTFTPGTSLPGTYVYTVPGIPPCPDDAADVVVTQVAAPDAGSSNAVATCSNAASFNMRQQLLGTPAAGGTWTGPSPVVNDQYAPATMSPGVYTYHVAGTAPCMEATAQLTVTEQAAPNAGSNGSITVCSNAAAFDLFTVLGGTPDVGGTWTGPGNVAHSNLFQPGVDAAGQYNYKVTGVPPCSDAIASVTVTVQAAPNPGTSTATSVCTNGAAFNMRTLLGTTATGTWTGPSPVTNNQYNPATMDPGLYTFTVAGVAPCTALSATVNVTEVQAPNAGTDGTKSVCSTGAAVPLFSRLGNNPDAGGTWSPGNGTYTPGIAVPGVYVFTYTVAGTAPCAADQSTVTVTEVGAPNAGNNGSMTLCSTDPPESLFVHLGGNPETGGTWYKPTPPGGTIAGVYNPQNANHPAGIYTYVVAGTTPCPADSATVTVIENPAPNAGTNGTITLCSTSSPVSLLSGLGGSPNGGGTWLGPTNQPFPGGTFNPTTHTAGLYKYIVAGLPPCQNDTGFVTVVVNTAPVAGTNGTTEVCSNAAAFPLFPLLGGSPNNTGTWSPGNGTYTPGAQSAGTRTFTYTVAGLAPCVNATATVTVTERRLPVAGSNGSVTLCSTEPPLNLFSRLGGTPDAGGTWSPGDASGVFTPGTSAPGVYTYTVPGTSPCPNVTAQVQVNVNTAPNSGVANDQTICQSQSTIDLFTALSGTPDLNGTWSVQGSIAPGTLAGSLFTTNGAPPGTYHFRYTVPANGQCAQAHTDVEIRIASTLNAGSDGARSVCRTNTAYNLFNALGNAPQAGGVWVPIGNSAVLVGQYLNATQLAASPPTYTFRYRLTGAVGCASDSATATITIIAAPNAGNDATLPLCSNQDPVSLFPQLGGGAQTGGTWKRLCNNQPFNGTYNPAVDSSCVFLYIKPGSNPCPNDTARVTVIEYQERYAGGSTTVTKCLTSAPFNMTNLLLGPPPMDGTWTSCNNQNHSEVFTPGLDPECTYTYTVPGSGICPQATATLQVNLNDPANPGTDGQVTFCSNNDPAPLVNYLFNDPDQGGTWTNNIGVELINGIFHPNTDAPGVYTYTVEGEAPCPDSSATVEVFVNQAPNAGSNTTASLCSTGAQVDMITLMNGSPNVSGTFSGPPGHPGTYNPATDNPGTFTYTVIGVPPCSNRTATLTITENVPNNPGCNTNISVCKTEQTFLLFDRLNCNPTPGGTFYNQSNTAVVLFNPQTTPAGDYQFRYVVNANGACAPDTAKLTISLKAAANAGADGSLPFCFTGASQPLFPALAGAQTGGTWRGPAGTHNGILIPSQDPPGNYWYKVTASAPCLADSAKVTVTINQPPNAGAGGSLLTCGNQAAVFTLLNYMTGSPSPGGTWSGPPGNPGFYIPINNDQGVFTYTVQGVSPCPSASAQVQVIENQPVNAGNDASRTVCTSEDEFQLFNLLTGSPTFGGQWYGPGNVVMDGFFDPGVDACATYKYKVNGSTPCPSDSSLVTITCNEAADAGISTANVLCPEGAAFLLLDLLGGSPDDDGDWFGPGGASHPSFFDPEVDPAGNYKYVVSGSFPCSNDSAYVNIQFATQPNAGTNGSTSACMSETAVNLFNALGGSPTPGGHWTGADQVNGIFDPSQSTAGQHLFTYIVDGNGTCSGDTAQVLVTVTNALFAGPDVDAQVCLGSNQDLLALLTGAQPGGIMRDLDLTGALIGTVLNASQAGAGTWHFRYVLASTASCPGDSAEMTITVVPGPNAGCGGTNVPLCTSASPFQLITLLGCQPNNNGQWFGPPGLTPHGPQFNPNTDQPGTYTYVVPAAAGCPADSASVTISLDQAADAGDFGTVAVCSNGDPVQLFAHLGGSPDPDGYWTCCGGFTDDGVYNPATDNQGPWVYHVNGPGACADASATVLVTEQTAPYAGGDNAITKCSSDAPFTMTSFLSNGPQLGGSWVDPDQVAHGPSFDPGTDAPGVYTYTVSGGSACTPDQAELTISVTDAPDAGVSATLNACATDAFIDVLAALGPNADAGGTWTDLDGAGAGFNNGALDATQVGVSTYRFVYNVAGLGPCPSDDDTVTVIINEGLDPGIGGDVTVCGGDIDYILFSALSGSPDRGGVWNDPLGTGALYNDSLLNTSLLPAGGPYQFGYTLLDPGCGETSSVVQITITSYPDPGADSSVAVCISSAAFDLFQMIGGDPDAGGAWTDPSGINVTSTFTPGISQAGTYRYQLNGNAPCADTSAAVVVTVNQPANAGSDGSLQRCNLGTLDLMTTLSGNAQPGGIWSDVDGGGGLSGNDLTLDQLGVGQYRYDYTVVVPGCGTDQSRLTLTVVEGVEVSDTVITCNEHDRTYTVQFTISGGDPSTYVITGLTGAISEQSPFVFTSTPIYTSQSFSLTADDANHCVPRVIEGGTPCVFSDDVMVPESFTPNGDGVNDLFVIPGIEGFPQNSIHIFNRWGAEMFSASGYDNKGVVWNGSSPDALLPGDAPTGTYYYVLELGNDSEALRGFIYLNR